MFAFRTSISDAAKARVGTGRHQARATRTPRGAVQFAAGPADNKRRGANPPLFPVNVHMSPNTKYRFKPYIECRAGLYARIHTLAGLSTQFEPPDHDTPTIHTEIRNCLGRGVFG